MKRCIKLIFSYVYLHYTSYAYYHIIRFFMFLCYLFKTVIFMLRGDGYIELDKN